jgi:hypothetical protein
VPEADSCAAANRVLFDYLVSEREERWWNGEAMLAGGDVHPKPTLMQADLTVARQGFRLYGSHGKALKTIRYSFYNRFPRLYRLFPCGRSYDEELEQLLRL